MFDVNFINPFIGATLNVLKVQAEIAAQTGKISLKKSGEPLKGDVSGIIGIVSEAFNGCVVISFPESTFLKIMSGMLGEELTEMNQELTDGAGEIVNIIFGQAKVVLNERGFGINMALPQVISGKGHSLSALSKGPIILVPFTSTAGDFFIEISLSK
jgi:chemotaxis protein CheX